MMRADLVTVVHNDTNYALHEQLFDAIRNYEPDGGYRLITVDNRTTNRGFARACNLGARHPAATAPIIGFLNPDLKIHGPFLDLVTEVLADRTVITGCRFGKPDHELRSWGVANWVCGAAMFVTRRWFTDVDGFDTQFIWSFEETDLIRRAEAQGRRCRPIALPFTHESPNVDSPNDAHYKRHHFNQSSRRFYAKWGRP